MLGDLDCAAFPSFSPPTGLFHPYPAQAHVCVQPLAPSPSLFSSRICFSDLKSLSLSREGSSRTCLGAVLPFPPSFLSLNNCSLIKPPASRTISSLFPRGAIGLGRSPRPPTPFGFVWPEHCLGERETGRRDWKRPKRLAAAAGPGSRTCHLRSLAMQPHAPPAPSRPRFSGAVSHVGARCWCFPAGWKVGSGGWVTFKSLSPPPQLSWGLCCNRGCFLGSFTHLLQEPT